MNAATFLTLIPLFPLLGFLINGLLYLISHGKLGSKTAPLGPHGGGHGEGHPGAGHQPHKAEIDGHALTHDPAHVTVDEHGHGHAPEEHAHHEIPFARAHSSTSAAASGFPPGSAADTARAVAGRCRGSGRRQRIIAFSISGSISPMTSEGGRIPDCSRLRISSAIFSASSAR